MIGSLCPARKREREPVCNRSLPSPGAVSLALLPWRWVWLSHCSARSGPSPHQPAVAERPLVGGFGQLVVECWSWESEKRWIPASLQDPPAHQASGQRESWRAWGIGWGRCSLGLQSPHQGRPLALAQASWLPWMSPPSSPPPPKSSESAGHDLCDLPPPRLCGLRSLRASWVGHLAPSVMTAG